MHKVGNKCYKSNKERKIMSSKEDNISKYRIITYVIEKSEKLYRIMMRMLKKINSYKITNEIRLYFVNE